jgi:phage terminase small subunit
MPRISTALSSLQQKFVDEYIKCRSKTEAARRAGYTNVSMAQAGYQAFRDPDVKAEIDRRLDAISRKVDLELEHLLEDLEEIKAKCMQAEMVFIDGQPSGQWQFDSRGALKAIELQGKLLNLFKEGPKVMDLGPNTLEALIGGSMKKEEPDGQSGDRNRGSSKRKSANPGNAKLRRNAKD